MALARQKGNIDVRLIDFAHTTIIRHKTTQISEEVEEKTGREESTAEQKEVKESEDRFPPGNGPDDVDAGLLLGFDNLISILKEIFKAELSHQQPSPSSSPQSTQQFNT